MITILNTNRLKRFSAPVYWQTPDSCSILIRYPAGISVASWTVEMQYFEIGTSIKGNLEDLSDDILCMQGVNYELGPIVKMTAPSGWRAKPLKEWSTGSKLFTSKILLFGIVPVDLHKIGFDSISESGFMERSSSLVNKEWIHNRRIIQENRACLVQDRVKYSPRLSILGVLLKPIYQAIFTHRHRRLKARFGTTSEKL